MTSTCPECGAPLPVEGSCRDYFHELLLLEGDVPGAPGRLPHFFAVTSYNLQHPSTFMPAMLSSLRSTLVDVLAGRGTLEHARRRTRAATDGPTRVLRRPDTVLSEEDHAMLKAWPTKWPMTVLDVCRVRPEDYTERVRQWAAAVDATLPPANALPRPTARRIASRRR